MGRGDWAGKPTPHVQRDSPGRGSRLGRSFLLAQPFLQVLLLPVGHLPLLSACCLTASALSLCILRGDGAPPFQPDLSLLGPLLQRPTQRGKHCCFLLAHSYNTYTNFVGAAAFCYYFKLFLIWCVCVWCAIWAIILWESSIQIKGW